MTTRTLPSIDVRGRTISTAIAEAVRPALSELAEGDELELRTERFEALVPDLQAWGRFAGHEVVEVVPDGAWQRVRLRRTAVVPRPPWRVAVVVSSDGLLELLSPLGFALAGALEGAAVAVYLQGPAVHVLAPDFKGRLPGLWRPFSRLARAGQERIGHVGAQHKLRQLQTLGGRIYACGPSLQQFKVPRDRIVLPHVTVCEYLTFMEVMADADVQLYS